MTYKLLFNGATFTRTWKPVSERRSVTVAEVFFNGATFTRTWKPSAWLQANPQRRSLQWSHVHSNVETTHACAEWAMRHQGSSMEPRSLERGNKQPTLQRGRIRIVFNGATFTRTWKRLAVIPTCLIRQIFNGATFTRTWKRDVVQAGLLFQPVSSMEPRSLERGNLPAVSGRWKRLGFFNGATFTRTWKPHLYTKLRQHSHSSMEPRSLERGNTYCARKVIRTFSSSM